MSAGVPCRCGTPNPREHWRVTQYKCNHSKFNGSRKTWSDYSEVLCLGCLGRWRSRAKYIEALAKATDAEAITGRKLNAERCPDCGDNVPTIFEHVDGCPKNAGR